jgi:hypothetical protein
MTQPACEPVSGEFREIRRHAWRLLDVAAEFEERHLQAIGNKLLDIALLLELHYERETPEQLFTQAQALRREAAAVVQVLEERIDG